MTYTYDITIRAKQDPLTLADLNMMGAAGWELVSILDGGFRLEYYFKKITA